MRRRYRYNSATDEVEEVGAQPQQQVGPHTNRAWEKPKHCEALAVEPHRVKWQQMEDAQLGLNTQYDSNGCPVFESRREYNEYVSKHGFYMRNAGYGDVAPRYR